MKTMLTILFFAITFPLFSQTTITMRKVGNVYTIPCEVNGLNLRFVFDTGASDVSISLAEVAFMIKHGYLEETDILGSSKYKTADGSIIENTKLNIRKIKIADITLYNVEASVVRNLKAPLLLGQSAIKQLGKIQIEGDKLTILKGADDEQDFGLSSDNTTRRGAGSTLWITVYEDDENKDEIELTSVKRKGDLVYFFERDTYLFERRQEYINMMLEFLKKYTYPNGIPRDVIAKWNRFSYCIRYKVCDCEKMTSGTISDTDYDDNGNALDTYDYEGIKWNNLLPGTIGYTKIKFVCDNF
jgi:clan AA aspartic protease (TIGR02281 family)